MSVTLNPTSRGRERERVRMKINGAAQGPRKGWVQASCLALVVVLLPALAGAGVTYHNVGSNHVIESETKVVAGTTLEGAALDVVNAIMEAMTTGIARANTVLVGSEPSATDFPNALSIYSNYNGGAGSTVTAGVVVEIRGASGSRTVGVDLYPFMFGPEDAIGFRVTGQGGATKA